MGIEIPEEFGGPGGSFFQCVLAIEELSAVDPSAGVIVDVQNTIVNNVFLHYASDRAEAQVSAAAGVRTRWDRMRCRRPDRDLTLLRCCHAPSMRAIISC